MANGLHTNRKQRLFYFVFTILPVSFATCVMLLSVFTSLFTSTNTIIAKNGVADLSNVRFSSSKSVLISGEYEFFWNKYIITDNLTNAQPDLIISVPSQWSSNKINNERLPSSGKATYRVTLTNCPQNQSITAFLPDIDCTYRVFLNNTLVYSLTENRPAQVYTYIADEPLPSESVLVIEILSRYSNGMYISPSLRNGDGFASAKSFIAFIGATLFGINLLALAFYVFIILTSRPSKFLLWRATLTVLAMIVVFSKDSFFDFWRAFLPSNAYYVFSITTHCAIAFVPYMSICFLVSLEIFDFNATIMKLYQSCGVIVFLIALGLGFTGQMHLWGIVLILSLLPLIHVLFQLYKLVKLNEKYSHNLSSATIYLFFALAFEILTFSGIMPYKIVLISPIFLTTSTILIAAYFVRLSVRQQSEATEAAQLRLSLRESEYSLMLSQIKPHFLYNALVAIEMLCTEEPAHAATATRQFSEYLRSNMRSISAKKPIPFLDEMNHIESYTAIEMLRFKNRLQYSANLEVTNFCVPPLTIQPLVENAIKHGACKNIKGGNVFVHSYQTKDFYCVEIIDNGVGFNVQAQNRDEPHGLSNIEMRLNYSMNARLEIFSVIGEGTRAVVSIPK